MRIDISEEFERVKDNLIYVDWNTISYISRLSIIKDTKLQKECNALSLIFKKLRIEGNQAFPYSIAHFLDIRNGDPIYLDKKILALEEFSSGWTLQEDVSNEFILKLEKCLKR
jgi:hypothetical protein